MFDKVKIKVTTKTIYENNKKKLVPHWAVYDGETLIHEGHREVDKTFQRKVYDSITKAGYNAEITGYYDSSKNYTYTEETTFLLMR